MAGSILRGEEALLYAERLKVEVTVSGVLRMSADRARKMIVEAPAKDRGWLVRDVTVHVTAEKAA